MNLGNGLTVYPVPAGPPVAAGDLVEDRMEITRVFLCELPFNLNLPNGSYTVPLDGQPFELQVLNGLVAIHFDQRSFAVDPPDRLRAAVPNYDQLYRQPLRTVLRNSLTVNVPDDQLPAVGNAELLEDLSAEVSGELMGSGGATACAEEAQRRLAALTSEERERRRFRGVAARYGRTQIRPAHEEFLAAANVLIRLYMERFGDSFVETISIDHLAAMSPMHGIVRQVFVGGMLADFSGIIGAVPPVMRGAWADHPGDQIDRFRNDLAAAVAPDSVKLLGVRAEAFLKRGANRSAIAEASAALDLSVSRKIRAGFRLKGKPDAETDALLKAPSNQRFDERAKKILREATGQSAADFDNTLWTRVVVHRTTHRQGTSHSDAEPSGAEAQQVVEDFLRLAGLVDGIAPR